jgi:hypothetical protein
MHASADALIMFNTDLIMLNRFKKSLPIVFSGKYTLFHVQLSVSLKLSVVLTPAVLLT